MTNEEAESILRSAGFIINSTTAKLCYPTPTQETLRRMLVTAVMRGYIAGHKAATEVDHHD